MKYKKYMDYIIKKKELIIEVLHGEKNEKG